MTKEIVCLDVETTGLNPTLNHIIQLSMVKFNSETFEIISSKNWYIKPEMDFHIESGAEKVHGITKEFILENGVTLRSIHQEILDMLGDCDILTYNGNSFDIKFLYNDLKELGLSISFKRKFYDSYVIECGRLSRTLAATYHRYTGHDFDNAHDACADVMATIEVFRRQQEATKEDIDKPEFNIVAPDGFVIYKDDILVMANGKYKDKSVVELMNTDPSYIKWVWSKASDMTCKMISEECKKAHLDKMAK